MENTYHVRTEFEIGERAEISKEVTEDDIVSFARITGDYNPVHIDPGFASKTRFKGQGAESVMEC